jgi:hypothetical protein
MSSHDLTQKQVVGSQTLDINHATLEVHWTLQDEGCRHLVSRYRGKSQLLELVHLPATGNPAEIKFPKLPFTGNIDNEFSGFLYQTMGIPARPDRHAHYRWLGTDDPHPGNRNNVRHPVP